MDPIVKECGCGRCFTKKQWSTLPQPQNNRPIITEDETGTYKLELRNCQCGSTIGIETKVQ